jgi:hypothetical protein
MERLRRDAEEMFQYAPGRSLDDPPPLVVETLWQATMSEAMAGSVQRVTPFGLAEKGHRWEKIEPVAFPKPHHRRRWANFGIRTISPILTVTPPMSNLRSLA